MATEECAICGEQVPFATTTHVLVNPKHVDGVADHYVCRPCYDEHLEGLFAALERDGDVATTAAGEAAGGESADDGTADAGKVADDGTAVDNGTAVDDEKTTDDGAGRDGDRRAVATENGDDAIDRERRD